jgi:LPS export ABC transporter permease LptG
VGLGRLSGDSEIVALGASGVSRLRVLGPVAAVALLIAACMLYITFNVLPRSISNLIDLKANQALIFQGLNTQIKPRVFEESIPGKVLYIEDINRASSQWHNIFLVDLGDEQGEMKIFTATSGALRQGARSDTPELYLQLGSVHQLGGSKGGRSAGQEDAGDLASVESAALDAANRRVTPEPPAQEGDRDKKRRAGQQNYTAVKFEDMTFGLEVTEEKKAESVSVDKDRDPINTKEWNELISYAPAEPERRQWLAEIHRRVALPAACLVFALLGVGFGISNVRTGRSFGLLLGLAITVLYYLLALMGENAALSGRLPVWVGIWLANLVLGGVGLFVLLMQRRPGFDPLLVSRSLRHVWRPRARDEAAGLARPKAPRAKPAIQPAQKTLRPLLLDRLVLSDLARFFFFILGGFSVLFIIITLFQLLNQITRHNIEWPVVANYLLFLLPMIVNYMTPLAALVAVMITYGILQKTSQLVALKASGQSIYRLAAPTVLAAMLLSAIVFVNQDYVLPFTNRRQNNLRHLIRSGQEPPQTFYQTTNQWIFGVESRIYNYAYFDPTSNVFARLNVIDLAKQPFGIKRRLYARRAWWDAGTREWVLESGWERQFENEAPVAYETFKERRVSLPEYPDHFKKDSRGVSSLTLAELRRKITDLSRSGFDVLDLRIALQSKIAFPLTCLIMVMVGLPFSLSVGKRGALYGVTIGIAIGLAYWGVIGLFEQMGRYEMLPPMLAAWGPNMLFGAGGLYLFLTSRT